MRVDTAVLETLSAAEIDGNKLRLPAQLDRSHYLAVDKVLKAAGGKWNGRARAHMFAGPAAAAIEPILLTGEVRSVKQDFGQFDSPPAVVARVIELARIDPGMTVLEPSAGCGNLALAAEKAGGRVMCVEIDARRVVRLGGIGMRSIIHSDFLAVEKLGPVDRVTMNPPFGGQADIDHVRHAAGFLRPTGRLVAVMSAGVRFRADRKAQAFREFLAQHGAVIEGLPPGSFAASGASVNACIVVLGGRP